MERAGGIIRRAPSLFWDRCFYEPVTTASILFAGKTLMNHRAGLKNWGCPCRGSVDIVLDIGAQARMRVAQSAISPGCACATYTAQLWVSREEGHAWSHTGKEVDTC